jgi:type I restriction-modification system DNA methylase subunit
MIWITPSEKDTATDTLEKRLWDAADQFRANSGLKPQEYSGPILGLIFLRFAEVITLAKQIQNLRRTRDLLLPRLLSGNCSLNL